MRGTYDQVFDNDRNPSILSSIKHFLSIPSLRHLPAASAIYGVGAFAVAVWMSSYLIRSFGMSSGEAGTWMALAYGGGGGVGIVTGGYLADLLARRTRDKRWYAWLSAITLVCVAPVAAVTFLTTDRTIAVWSLVLGTALSHMFIGPLVASLQSLAGVRRRAIIAASYLLIQNLVSMGIGPLAVGLVSDYFASRVGGASLKVALLAIVPLSAAWASLHFLLASRTLNEDLDNAARTDAANLATKPELVPAPRQVWDNAEGLVR
jgi:MFS family permease